MLLSVRVGGIDTSRKNEGRRKPFREKRGASQFTFSMKGQRLPEWLSDVEWLIGLVDDRRIL